ncbi:MAG TPA: serine/threonine-protein kinase, partial [Candidatus Eisenbacteria bacterium]
MAANDTRSPDPTLADTIAATASGPGTGTRVPSSEMPEQIGDYRILRILGAGGMGVVYLAEQQGSLRRQVALKVIRPDFATDDVLSRFENERRSLALMNHESIARVHDAGTTSAGQPYFVMEYVDGPSITRYCDERRLSVDERLELFIRVCHGVQHAHQKAVIHRDLKPSNILVVEQDGRPVPKIIDFGVAKATAQRPSDATMVTRQGQWIGTLE